MKIKGRKWIIAGYIAAVLAGLLWHAGGASAQETIKLKLNTEVVTPGRMGNMQPGDETRSRYTIVNEGGSGFSYSVDFRFVSGDRLLYDILQMTLVRDNKVLYSGKMSEAEGRITVGQLLPGKADQIEMKVGFPAEAGNEYQGLTASVAFVFAAAGEPGPSPSPTVSPSPGPSAAPSPTVSPSPGPSAAPSPAITPSPDPSAAPSPAVSPSPGSSAAPSPAVTPSPGSSAAPSPAVTPAPDAALPDEEVPLGGLTPSASPEPPGANANPPGQNPPAGPQHPGSPPGEIPLDDPQLPLSGPEPGTELPDTASPWYNLLAAGAIAAGISLLLIRRWKPRK
ncbi:hypothetical protein ACE6ED_28670 [Paenibacillus sp. CN-4]|uniref:hypothetical protein n=1 Tax=Paenibacillus nanchangensis TaxID=3348343 RepID=UPI00397CAD3E